MRVGICCGPERIDAALAAGADYVEIGATNFQGLLATVDLDPFLNRRIEATNVFLEGSIRLFGDEATPWRDYVARTLERAAEIDVQVMVIGSGGSRRAPADYPIEKAESEFVAFAAEVSRMASVLGITIAPESLNRTETNVGNNLATMGRELQKAGVAYTADSHHILKEWDLSGRPDLDAWMADHIPHLPAHVHLGDLPRDWPKPDDPHMQAFFARLKQLGYEGRVSLECRIEPFETELPKALAAIRELAA